MTLRSIPPIVSCGTTLKKPRKQNTSWKPHTQHSRTVSTPLFKKVKEPIVDVFNEDKEIRVIMDLGNFSRGEVDIDIKPDRYIIFAKHDIQEFREEIVLASKIDIEKTLENFRNGILEITLPIREK